MPQDQAPIGGFPTTIKFQRNLPKRGPSGAVVIIGVFAMMTYGFIQLKHDNAERMEIRREKIWARINLVPLLQAEIDRDTVRRFDALHDREVEIMKTQKGWSDDLKARVTGIGKNGKRDPEADEPVYHTKRYVAPTMVFLPKEGGNLMDAQWWRGTKVFTKNPPYQDRPDFTKEYPIGQ